jgi:hypothetical protein
VLVTVRIVDGVASLRHPKAWEAIVRLVRKARGRFGMHVVEYSVLTNHLHMIVECDDPDSLERGAGRRPTPGIDRRSTASRFDGWRTPPATPNRTKDYGTTAARTWLLKTGWRRHGLLDVDEPVSPFDDIA